MIILYPLEYSETLTQPVIWGGYAAPAAFEAVLFRDHVHTRCLLISMRTNKLYT